MTVIFRIEKWSVVKNSPKEEKNIEGSNALEGKYAEEKYIHTGKNTPKKTLQMCWNWGKFRNGKLRVTKKIVVKKNFVSGKNHPKSGINT